MKSFFMISHSSLSGKERGHPYDNSADFKRFWQPHVVDGLTISKGPSLLPSARLISSSTPRPSSPPP
jgi:hypothetical protein